MASVNSTTAAAWIVVNMNRVYVLGPAVSHVTADQLKHHGGRRVHHDNPAGGLNVEPLILQQQPQVGHNR